MTTASIRTTAFPTTMVQEISEFIESSDVQLASVAALLNQFSSAQKDKLSKLKTSAESGQKEFREIKKALAAKFKTLRTGDPARIRQRLLSKYPLRWLAV